MKNTFSKILYGGDYNPNQWPREVWAEDMRLFKDASINSATINVFSWAKIQPSENKYDFTELDDIVDMLTKEGYAIVMATSTGALPAWMAKKYPEVTRTDFRGVHKKYGARHNACPNSPVYQKYSRLIAEKLAIRYKDNPNIVCWHVSNEYTGECYCENCEREFRVWLEKKYGDISALNKAWNTEFWGHTFYNWDEIVLPNELSDDVYNFPGLSLDYRRFNSQSLLNNYIAERDAIRNIIPDAFITTNLMGTYKPLNYFEWAKEMDIVSWDCYPSYNTPWSLVAMTHDLMRGLKAKPFMLMEQTPSQQNWQPYNSLKKPGQMRAQSYQTMAHGGDTIQFFQLRRSVGGCEKFHGAVISHSGSGDTRVFREVSKLGKELDMLGTKIMDSKNISNVGIIFDWENYWALEYTVGPTKDLKYIDQIQRYYKYFYDKNISVDMIPVDADFSKYSLVVAPVLYMVKDSVHEALEEYVKNGGVFVTTYMSGIAGESDNVHLGGYPGPLRKMAGIWAEEIDALAPEQSNLLKFTDGEECSCNLLCDLIRLEGAKALAHYGTDFYEGMPAVTVNKFGDGTVYYIGTQPSIDGINKIFDIITAESGVKPVIEEKTDLEITCREKDGKKYYFLINFGLEDVALPKMFVGKTDLISNETLSEDKTFKRYDVAIIEF